LDRDLGVIVQDCESGDYGGLDADVGVVTHRDLLRANMHAYRRFMDAGLNVACHGGQSYLPQTSDPALAAEIDTLARANGVTFTGCGIWDMSRIWAGILAAGPCTDITSLHHRSLTDPEGQVRSLSPESPFNQPLERFYERNLHRSPVLLAHKAIPELVMQALGYTVADSVATIDPVVYDVPVTTRYVPEGFFDAGLCVGVRTRVEVTSTEGVVATTLIEQRMFLPEDVEHMVWEVEGTPRNRVRVERLDSAEATAGNLFNRIPDIVAAPPGIVPVTELGPLRSSASRWPAGAA
jgi:4-hydroxy-tetrahydrodipicolinate reductase